MKEQLTNWD